MHVDGPDKLAGFFHEIQSLRTKVQKNLNIFIYNNSNSLNKRERENINKQTNKQIHVH